MSTSTPQVHTSAGARRRATAAARGVRPARPQSRLVPWWAVVAAAVAAAAAIAAAALLPGTHNAATPVRTASPLPTAVVAEVDGQPVPVREFALYLAQERAATFAYFQQQFGVADGPRFWTTPHGGETPAEHLKKRALADVTSATVELALAHRSHLLTDPGYDAFLRSWAAENARRRAAVAAHQVIYGPVQYTEANYFTYVLNGLAADLEHKLADTGAIPTPDSALRAYYQAHPDTFHEAQSAHAPFSEIRDQVRLAYVHDRYLAMVDRMARSARVHVEQTVLDAVPVN